jgi:protein-tyrosine phosphatase
MRILFVCLGNICRSPLAEGVLLHMNEKLGLAWHIDSAGTAGYHIGEAPDRRTMANAAKHGVDLKPLRARQFTAADFDRFDHVLVMDQNNYNLVVRQASNAEQKAKVNLFLELALNRKNAEVPDPYYGSEKDFEEVFQLVQKGCEGLVQQLKVE